MGPLPRAPGGSAFGECPMCGRRRPLSGLAAHVEACLAVPERKPERKRRRPEPGAGPRVEAAAPAAGFKRRTGGGARGAGGVAGRREGAVEWAPDDSGGEGGGGGRVESWPSRGGSPPLEARLVVPHGRLEGLYVVEGFVSPEEEEALLALLDADSARNPWRPSTFNGSHAGKAYGVRSDLKARRVRAALHGVPAWGRGLARRMRRLGRSVAGTPLECMAQFRPNDCNAIEYLRTEGHWLKAHSDDRHLSGDVLVTLSLCGDCDMQFELAGPARRGAGRGFEAPSPELALVSLPRRSLLVQAGGVRYTHTHGIPNDCLRSPRRVSITFRETMEEEPPRATGGGQAKLLDFLNKKIG